MVLDKTVEIQSYTSSISAEGREAKTYIKLKDIAANIQPTTLSPAQIKEYGADDTGKAKIMFYDNDNAILELYRVKDGSDYYIIKCINKWPNHYEATLLPI